MKLTVIDGLLHRFVSLFKSVYNVMACDKLFVNTFPYNGFSHQLITLPYYFQVQHQQQHSLKLPQICHHCSIPT